MRPGAVLFSFSFISVLLPLALGNSAVSRSPRRSPRCSGCPPHFCDDDPAIIHGYCCGCARFFDVLPVKCPFQLDCPLNNYDLCEDYEYMMHCCCD